MRSVGWLLTGAASTLRDAGLMRAATRFAAHDPAVERDRADGNTVEGRCPMLAVGARREIGAVAAHCP